MKKIAFHHIMFAARPRLSDEELDLIEQDDVEGMHNHNQEGWLPWDTDSLIDIRKIIEFRMGEKERMVIEAALMGMSFLDLGVSEKFFRYHYEKGIEFIKIELKL